SARTGRMLFSKNSKSSLEIAAGETSVEAEGAARSAEVMEVVQTTRDRMPAKSTGFIIGGSSFFSCPCCGLGRFLNFVTKSAFQVGELAFLIPSRGGAGAEVDCAAPDSSAQWSRRIR